MGELYNLSPKLPKNVRQIGERDQIVKLYVEDYVNTYLRRLYPAGGEDLRCGLLLGSTEEDEGAPCIFIDGALEMEGVSCGGEKVELTDQAWKKAYRDMEEMFPKRNVQGWFLCGAPGSQLSPLNYWKIHSKHFPGKNMIMYLNSGLEGEEALYIASEDGFYKLRGYSIYYERNQMMQDYMISRKDVKRVDAGVNDTVIRDFRRKMEERKEEAEDRRSTVNVLGGICGALSVAVLAGGIVMFNNYGKMKEMESVLVSVLPAGSSLLEDYGLGGEPELVLETGTTVLPETMEGETGESLTAGNGANGGEVLSENGAETVWAGTGPEGSESGSGAADAGTAGAGNAGHGTEIAGTSAGAGGTGNGTGAAGTGTGAADRSGTGAVNNETGMESTKTPGGTGTGETGAKTNTSGTGTVKPAETGADTANQAAGTSGTGESRASGDGSSKTAAAGSSDTAALNSSAGADSALSPAAGTSSANSAPSADSGRSEDSVPASALPEADIPSLEEADEQMTAIGEQLASASTHVVQEGETLYGICLEKYHNLKRVDEICRLNGLEDVNKIKAGQKLILP